MSELVRWQARILALLPMVAVLLVSPAILSCTQASASDKQPAPSASSAPSDYALKVTEGDKVLASLSLADITSLPSVKITADGKQEQGPTLLSVLGKAGVTDFKRVTVVGMQKGRSHSASLPLDRLKVTDKVILSANQRGETKLASPDIPGEAWIVDVSRLEVERQ